MSENVCCPELRVVGCQDTSKHNHLYCDTQFTIEHTLMSNDWVKKFCLGNFQECKYYPKGDQSSYIDELKKGENEGQST